MKIGLKLTLSLVVPLIALTVVIGFLYQRRSQELLREELNKEGRAISLVVQIATEDYLRDRQFQDLTDLIDRVTGYQRVLGLRLFDADGRLLYQSSTLAPYPFRHRNELSTVLRERRIVEMRRQFGSETAVGIMTPLVDRNGTLLGAVQVLQLESYIHEDSVATLKFILILSLAMAIATLAIVMLVTRASISQPIARLVSSFREIGGRGIPSQVPITGEDELGLLAREFNGMCNRLQSAQLSLLAEQDHRLEIETQLRNAERLAGLGRLAAGLAHEIGTPLNVISGRAESVLRDETVPAAARSQLRIITDQTERIVRIVRDMLDFARPRPSRRLAVQAEAVARHVVELLEPQLEKRGIQVAFEASADLPLVHADPDQLQQVFLNLTLNAMDAMTDGGRLGIRADQQLLVKPEPGGAPQECVTLEFEDTGSGIRPEDRNHVFDPFFTTKEAGQGTGLGLAVSYGIIEDHGGWFELQSHPQQGTRITVILPAILAASRASA